MKFFLILILLLSGSLFVRAQTTDDIINKVRAKLDKVNDYQAKGKMKTNVLFIKAPIANVRFIIKNPINSG